MIGIEDGTDSNAKTALSVSYLQLLKQGRVMEIFMMTDDSCFSA